uniref:Lectin/glucanase superfamily protein n=1 Tax=viral metagenome TaxID=1070528 RepID=A0A6M3KNE6_9ZZZZ
MQEIVSRRTETSKTYDLGDGKRRLESRIGAIHYRDNYSDPSEQWKDIDLTWVGNRIDKAPYELTLDGQKITVRDKKSGEISTIELTEIKPAGLKFEIVPENTRVSFRHTLPSDKIPFEASFKITGKGLITTKAFDDDGEIMLDAGVVGDTLTEKLPSIVDKATGKVRPAKGLVKVDPTWQVAASTDDVTRRITASLLSLIDANKAGYYSAASKQFGCGMRFLNITIPNAQVIDSAYLILRCSTSQSGVIVNTRISAEDVDDAVTFAQDEAAFDARFAAHTTARIDWDAIPAWTLDTDYNSPEIKTVIQEIVDRVGWASGNDIVLFWEDFEDRSTHATNYCRRDAYSYDGSAEFCPKLVINYTEAPIPTSTDITTAMTGLIWIKSSRVTQELMGKWDATNNKRCWAWAMDTSLPRLYISDDGTGSEAEVATTTVSSDVMTMLGFVYVAATDKVRFFINGVFDVERTFTGETGAVYSNATVKFQLGRVMSGSVGSFYLGSQYLPTLIPEAWTDDQVKNWYQQTSHLMGV